MRHIAPIAFLAVLCFSHPLPVAASSLFVSCGVPGAAVLVDSREAGTTDVRGEVYIGNVAPGDHTVAIVMDGYATHTESIAVKDKLTSFITAAMKRADTTLPEIMVLSPPSLRGIKAVVGEDAVEIIGLARAVSRIVSVTVNGQAAALTGAVGDDLQRFPGVNVVRFTARINLAAGDNTIQIEAFDEAGNRGTLQQIVERQAQSPARSVGMDCYALLIGVDDYANWPDLRNPIHDVTTLAEELKTNYGYSTEVLTNPTKRDILTAIRSYYDRTFSENSELLIVMSGHGHFDDDSKTGYFIGADGLAKEQDTIFNSYIDYPSLQQVIANIPCGHIMLVLDACFGGTMNIRVALRGGEETYRTITKEEFILRKLKYKTRLLMTSGGKEYVPDGRPEQHSPFMRKFLEGLRGFGGQDGILTIEELMANYMNYVEPEPYLLEFQFGNDPGSSFLFIAH